MKELSGTIEFGLTTPIKLAFNGSQIEVKTLVIDNDKMASTKLALKVDNYFVHAIVKSQNLLTNDKDKKYSQDLNTQDKETILDKEPLSKASISATGAFARSNLDENTLKYIFDTFYLLGCIFYENPDDLARKNILELFHIKDIDYIVGYYAVNFTLSRLQG